MYYEERPPLVTVATAGSKYHTTVNYSIEESGEGFEVESATVVTDAPIDESCYGLLVSAIVRARYSADQVEAIVRARGDFREVLRTNAGCTVSNHCGSKTLGLLFYRRK